MLEFSASLAAASGADVIADAPDAVGAIPGVTAGAAPGAGPAAGPGTEAFEASACLSNGSTTTRVPTCTRL